jgi:putative transposase
MPRKPRDYSPECAYHVIVRGNNRQDLFRKTPDRERFLFFIQFLKSEYDFHLYHYCLMTNHVHLLMRFPQEQSFRKVPQRLFLLYAKYFSREYAHVGHVFQDRYKSFPVQDNRYLLECGRYIERNPIKARLVGHPGDYKWSSYGFYGRGEGSAVLTKNPLYDGLETSEEMRRSLYERFVVVERPYELEVERHVLGQGRRNRKVSP